MSDRNEHAATVLDKWASAIRSNWGDIDGRTCRSELNEISAYLRGEKDNLTPDDVGVCDEGNFGAHWNSDCQYLGYHIVEGSQ